MKKIHALAYILALNMFCCRVEAKFPQEIIIVGDSLSDQGNTSTPVHFVPNPSSEFVPLTDGVTWPYILTKNLDAEIIFPYTHGGANLGASFKQGSVLSFGYFFNIGSFDMSEQVLTLGFNIPLRRK